MLLAVTMSPYNKLGLDFVKKSHVRSRSPKMGPMSILGRNFNCCTTLCESFSVGPSDHLIKE